MMQIESRDQLQIFGSVDTEKIHEIDFISIEQDPLLRLPYRKGVIYTKRIIEQGEQSVNDFTSFRAKFEIVIDDKKNQEFVNAMKAEGYTVISNRIPPVCDICHEEIGIKNDASYSFSCDSCGGETAHSSCGDFYNHGDHDCFAACCHRRHIDPKYITEQDFFDTTPISKTYVEEDIALSGSKSEKIVYVVSHYRLSLTDRIKIARKDYLNLRRQILDETDWFHT